jgi:hypothetical protein
MSENRCTNTPELVRQYDAECAQKYTNTSLITSLVDELTQRADAGDAIARRWMDDV